MSSKLIHYVQDHFLNIICGCEGSVKVSYDWKNVTCKKCLKHRKPDYFKGGVD